MTHNRKHTPHFKLFEHSEFLKWGVYIVSIVRHLDFSERDYFLRKTIYKTSSNNHFVQHFIENAISKKTTKAMYKVSYKTSESGYN